MPRRSRRCVGHATSYRLGVVSAPTGWASTLLASQAGVWPVLTHADGLDVPSLYGADNWGPPQSDMARRMQLRYLYVDRRFADEPPRVGTYFDESPPLQLTHAQLTKFNSVPGIQEVYRHGPISIYDLGGLGVPELRSGWFGQTQPINIPTQVVIGLLLGRCARLNRAFRCGE